MQATVVSRASLFPTYRWRKVTNSAILLSNTTLPASTWPHRTLQQGDWRASSKSRQDSSISSLCTESPAHVTHSAPKHWKRSKKSNRSQKERSRFPPGSESASPSKYHHCCARGQTELLSAVLS